MLFILFLSSTIFAGAIGLTGPHVCNETRPHITYKMEPYHEPRPVSTHRWTWKPPFRKKTIRYEFEVKTKPVLHQVDVIVSVCCPGYEQVEDQCMPICSSPCLYGDCVDPDTCRCYPGFNGDTCYVPCSNNFYGQDCQSKCQCSIHSTCDVQSGECTCDDGYQGEFCEQKCAEGYHGENCMQQCTCHGHGKCHHIHGKCDCDPGWFGPECHIRCPYPLYGYYCMSHCPCIISNANSCDPISGRCNCKHGWTGSSCEVSAAAKNVGAAENTDTVVVAQLYPPSSATGESSSPKIATVIWTIAPFVILLSLAIVIFIARKRFWQYNIERQPLEDHVTYNPSTGSLVFSLRESRSHVSNPLYAQSSATLPSLSVAEGPPAYENCIREPSQATYVSNVYGTTRPVSDSVSVTAHRYEEPIFVDLPVCPEKY